MKKENYEKLGELERIIYDYIWKAFKDGTYELKVNGGIFGDDGYVDGEIIIGGYVIRCSFNKEGYVCWLCEKPIVKILEGIPQLEKRCVAQVKRIVKEKENEWKKKRVKELQEEIERLKK